MRIGPLRINLATSPKPKVDAELGTATAGGSPSIFGGEVFAIEDVKHEEYVNMVDNDGTAEALYNVLTLPIVGNSYGFEPADDSPEAKIQRDFVRESLTLPPHMGGMTTPFELVLGDMLRAVLEEYRAFEKVYALKDGKITFKKIATRDRSTTTILQDERGGFNGFKQEAYIGSSFKTVTIDREKAFLFTFGKERRQLKGRSAFRSAYFHYDRKHKLYYLSELAVQQFAIPPKAGIGAEGSNQAALDAITDTLDEMATNSSAAFPHGVDVKTLTANGRIDPMPLIDHHNAEMARSVLAHFIMLGTGSSVGSWALSSDQSDMFIIALRSLMKSMEAHINSYLIPDLVNYNFATAKYPRMVYSELTDAKISLLKEVFMKIVDKLPEGSLPESFTTDVVRKMADGLGIDLQDSVGLSRSKRRFLADGRWKRPLTPAETKVNFAGLQKKFDLLENEYTVATKAVWSKVEADVLSRLRNLIDKKDWDALDDFEIEYGDEYRNVIVNQLMDAYSYAKIGAADELGVKAPSNSTDTKKRIKEQAQAIVDKQFADLMFVVRSHIDSARRKNLLAKTNLDTGEFFIGLEEALAVLYTSKIAVTSEAVISSAVNTGRDDVFQSNKERITKYQYSAILDERTCPDCEELDGSVVTQAEYDSTSLIPPIHFGCRCIWVAILEDEIEQPDLTGLPDITPQLSEASRYCVEVMFSSRMKPSKPKEPMAA